MSAAPRQHSKPVLVQEGERLVSLMNHVVNEPTGLFQRCPFDSTVIILCIRWDITYKRSYRDVVAIMAERNVDVVYTTIVR